MTYWCKNDKASTVLGLSLFLILFANSPRLENDLSDSTEVGGIDFRARNNFSRLTDLVLLASKSK
jgi:hypothetical protein